MSKLTKKQLFIINNLIIFFTAAIAVPVTLIVGSRTTRLDNTPYPYWMHIVSFTLLSGIFMGLVAGVTAFIALFAKMKKMPTTPHKKAIQLWYLAATTASMITCLTVLFFLAPMRAAKGGNYFDPLLETMFFLHFFNPVFAAITYIFTMDKIKITWRARLLSALPFVIYAIVYLTCVILGLWPDFYGLTFGGKYYLTPIVFLVFLALSYGITSGLVKLRDVLQK